MGRRGALLVLLGLGGCAGPNAAAGLPRGAAAYLVVPAAADAAPAPVPVIGALDQLDVVVFGEPDLSARALPVDAGGDVVLPLVGTVHAAGLSAAALARLLEGRLGDRYLRHPRVAVTVVAAGGQQLVVQGEVREPGAFPLKGPVTLLGAIALARGETRVAALREVVVFRPHDGRRAGAVFDVDRIRRGDAADPLLRGGDLVVVGYSNARGWWRDFLQASPLVAAARPIL